MIKLAIDLIQVGLGINFQERLEVFWFEALVGKSTRRDRKAKFSAETESPSCFVTATIFTKFRASNT